MIPFDRNNEHNFIPPVLLLEREEHEHFGP